MNLGQIKLKLSQYKSLNPKSGDQDQFQIFLEGKTEGEREKVSESKKSDSEKIKVRH